MNSFSQMIDNKNRVDFNKLCEFIRRRRFSEYTGEAIYPFLVGKSLYDGEMERQSSFDGTTTMRFNVSALRHPERASHDVRKNEPLANDSAISRAIYQVHKNANSMVGNQNEYHIGRRSDNDIIIPDFVISKYHAIITNKFSRYFITDLGSTNGTTLNGEMIPANELVPLTPGSNVGFGRYCFIFTQPQVLYRIISRHIA